MIDMEKYSTAKLDRNKIGEGKYHVVCYMRIDPDEMVPLSYDYAPRVKDQLELMQPKNMCVFKWL